MTKTKTLTTAVVVTDIDEQVGLAYDYTLSSTITSEVHSIDKTKLPNNFGIGLIVGQSGSGKSSNLLEFGNTSTFEWDNSISIASNFESYDVASDRLHGCGLNSIKVWTQPHYTLSTGQAYRANMAATIDSDTVYDEFCSYLDMNTAKSLSNSVRKYVDKHSLTNVVFATCNSEIEDWLQPDWTFDCNTGDLVIRGLDRQRPQINLTIHPCTVSLWSQFSQHHYLSASINKGSRCWVAMWDEDVVGFYATLPQPSGTMKNAWRGSRMVILPEFQGLGLSTALCETVAQIHLDSGKRFFAKTASELLGGHREKGGKWKPTSKNRKKRSDYNNDRKGKYSKEHLARHAHRVCYSHEYLGYKEED